MTEFKLAFIGPGFIHEPLAEIYKEDNWDFQIPVEDLSAFEAEMDKDELESQISKDTSVIIFFSRLFDSDPNKFAELVSLVAPYSVTCILIPEADIETKKNMIESKIRQQQQLESVSIDSGYNPNTPFYFVSYENPQVEILESIQSFVNSPIIDETIRDAVRPMLPDNVSNFEDEFEDYSFQEEDPNAVVIPERDLNAKGKIITVTSSKGGSGKSTVAMALATYISRGSKISFANEEESRKLKVCLVDMDVRDGQLGFLNGALQPNIVTIMSEGPEPTIENIKSGIWHNSKIDCDFVFAAKRPRNAIEISPNFYAKLINNLRSMYDYVILDTSVNYLDPLLEEVAYPMADQIVFVTDMGISSIFGMRRWIKETTAAPEKGDKNIPIDKIGIVVNKVMKNIGMTVEKIQNASDGANILSFVPSAPSLITYAANTNNLGEILNNELINKAIKNIADVVVEDYTLSEVPYTPTSRK